VTVLARRVAATPDRTALVDAADGRQWRYRDLAIAVDRVADRLWRCLDTVGGSDRTDPPVSSAGDRRSQSVGNRRVSSAGDRQVRAGRCSSRRRPSS